MSGDRENVEEAKQVPRRKRHSLLAEYHAQLKSEHPANTAPNTYFTRRDALMRRIVEASMDGILTIHDDGRIGMANKAAADMFGYSPDALRTQKFEKLIPDAHIYLDPHSDTFNRRETLAIREDSSSFPIDLHLSRTLFGSETLHIAIVRNITEMKEQRKQLEHQALHDALTGLPNRLLLGDRMDLAMHSARRDREPVALLFLDLDNFKEVNDTLGHHIGDMLLKEIGKRLKRPLRPTDTVARLGGDEFAILLTGTRGLERALEIAERVRKVITQPITVLDALDLEVGVSIGVALCPEHAQETSTLMQCADVAMYAAKAGNNKIVVYNAEEDKTDVRHLTLVGELRQAIEENALSLAYQPITCVQTGGVYGIEALTRWMHPKLGEIEPAEFIPQAEQTSVIQSLTHYVLKRALTRWADNEASLNVSRLSINLSPRSLHDEAIIKALEQLLNVMAFPAQNLMLEITETAIFLDPEHALTNIKRLRDIGFKIGLDDFGTGFSSLSFLQKLPLDELKIDRSFINGMEGNEANAAIVRSTINLAHDLGLKTVAEGVENARQLEMVKAFGCDFAQGYHIAGPMDEHSFYDWLSRQETC